MSIACGVASLVLIKTAYELIAYWLESPEFGHGLILCLIAFSVIWKRRYDYDHLLIKTSLMAYAGVVLGFLLHLISIAGDIQAARFYSFMIILCSCSMYFTGTKGLKLMAFPVALLFLSVPLHPSINTALTTTLQLVSTDIGVWFIRLMGMAALQDGNVINLGSFVLLVEEACSGLRYLLPLVCFHIILAYYFKGGFFLKAVIVASAIPITVFTNSLRIALTGLIIKYFGAEAASGFLHDFEGLAVFALACFITLTMLTTLSWWQHRTFNVLVCFKKETPSYSSAGPSLKIGTAFYALMSTIVVLGAINIYMVTAKKEHIPERQAFSQFPLALAGRDLYPNTLDDQFIEMLKPDDYFIGDYIADGNQPVNLYMAYYALQKNGSLIHSPSQCIPAGGWAIEQQQVIPLEHIGMLGNANRAIIKKDNTSLLVYYWVHQQGENFASDRDVYFSLIKRSILHNRTDGTLVRIITPVIDDDIQSAEAVIEDFIVELNNVFPNFLPQ